MHDSSSRGIFLSYRRDDAAPYARLLQLQLRERFPDADVFMDLDSIEPGLDFAEVIEDAVESCAVLVALIGRQWVTLLGEDGNRRLDDPDDFVRFELETALERGTRVIPVLVDGAKPVRRHQLPPGLHKLARLNAIELSYGRYQYDAKRLLDLVERVVEAAVPETPAAGDAAGEVTRSAIRILAEAELVARALPTPSARVAALLGVGKALAATEPNRAAGLITDAERTARSIVEGDLRAVALVDVAQAVALTDQDRARQLAADAEGAAESTTGEGQQWAHINMAGGLAVNDPDRAERIAHSITHDVYRTDALSQVARALAVTDPRRAARIARSIPDESGRMFALLSIAKALTAGDPTTAARMIADDEAAARSSAQLWRLAHVAEAWAAIDPDRALHIARSLTDEYDRGMALTNVVQALAITEPDRAAKLAVEAEHAARSMDSEDQDEPLVAITKALAATDPDRAEHMAGSITHGGPRESALTAVAAAVAATDPDRAVRIARTITNEHQRAFALSRIARALAATDLDRAEGIARSIPNRSLQVWALIGIAEMVRGS